MSTAAGVARHCGCGMRICVPVVIVLSLVGWSFLYLGQGWGVGGEGGGWWLQSPNIVKNW